MPGPLPVPDSVTPTGVDPGRPIRPPTLPEALAPVATLIFLLALALLLFGGDAVGGPMQVALIFSGLVAAAFAIRRGHTWASIVEAVTHGLSGAMAAIFILLAVGTLIGTWAISGTIAAMVVYGEALLDPAFFYPAAAIVSALVAASIGSAWTVAGTIGVGLVGIATIQGLSPAITAGAVVSGGFFGSKVSPLSDTVILASGVAGTPLYAHIRNILWSAVPALGVAVVVFTVLALTQPAAGGLSESETAAVLESLFNLSPVTFLPIAVVVVLALRAFPPFPTIMAGALAAAAVAVAFQPDVVREFVGPSDLPDPLILLKGVWAAMGTGFAIDSGVPEIDRLLSIGGMESMLGTIWLVLCAMSLGIVLETTGVLERLNAILLRAARSTGRLIAATVATGIGINVIAGEEYLAIVLPGKMYKAEFTRRGLPPQDLSAAIDDSGTSTAPLIPWNTAGAYHAAVLGVPTVEYAVFAVFCYVSPLLRVIYGFTGFRVGRVEPPPSMAEEEATDPPDR